MPLIVLGQDRIMIGGDTISVGDPGFESERLALAETDDRRGEVLNPEKDAGAVLTDLQRTGTFLVPSPRLGEIMGDADPGSGFVYDASLGELLRVLP